MKLDTEALVLAAADYYNAIARAHAVQTDELAQSGHGPELCAVASYLAARTMVALFEDTVRGITSPDSLPGLESIIRTMAKAADEERRKPHPVASA